jgi:hypothetical protein
LTTPFGVFPDRDHKHTFYLSNIISILSDKGEIVHLSVVDGYIRVILEKVADDQTIRVVYDAPSLIEITESATRASQISLWQELDSMRSMRDELLKSKNELINKNNAHSGQIKAIEADLKSLEEKVISIRAERDALAAQFADRIRDQDAADARRVAAERDADVAQATLKEMERQLAAVREELKHRDEEIGKLRSFLDEREVAMAGLRADLDAALAREQAAVLDAAEVTRRNEALSAAVQAADTSTAAQRTEHEAERTVLRESLDRYKAEAEALRNSLGEILARNTEGRGALLDAQHYLIKLGALGLADTSGDARPAFGIQDAGQPAVVSLTKRLGLDFRFSVEPQSNLRLNFGFAEGFLPVQKQDALIKIRFFDHAGTPLAPPYPKTQQSDKAGSYRYLYPLAKASGEVSLEIETPPSAATVHLSARAWRSGAKVGLLNRLTVSIRDTADAESSLLRRNILRALEDALHDADKAIAPADGMIQLPSPPAAKPSATPPASAAPVEETGGLLGPTATGRVRPAKALSILDEISDINWSSIFDLEAIHPEKWANQIDDTDVDFVFLESCWKGNAGRWEYAFTSPGLKHVNAQKLLLLIERVRQRGLPVVFWNKEDPMHFERFLPIAQRASHILTTDSNCLSGYAEAAPGASVGVLSFGAEPTLCNPSDRTRTEPESVCFAGTYYPEHHDERLRQMNFVLPAIEAFNGAIYDRYSHLETDRYRFPDRYQPFIRPSVPFREMAQLYKRFRVFLNVNTIIDSPTMMSRRVYELLACGTPVVSAPSAALEAQFADIVATGSTEREIKQHVGKLLDDKDHWHRTAQRGMRAVLGAHTYRHGGAQIATLLGLPGYDAAPPLVSIVLASCRPKNLERIIENVSRQTYPNMELLLSLTPNFSHADINRLRALVNTLPNLRRVEVQIFDVDVTLGRCLNEAIRLSHGEYIAKFDDDNFYLDHYLADLMLPFQFDDYDVVGKESYFCYLGGSDRLIWRYPEKRFCQTKFVAGDAMIMQRRVFERLRFPERRVGEDTKLLTDIIAMGGKIYTADHFNFIKYRSADLSDHTWRESEDNLMRQSRVVATGLDIDIVRV